MLTHKRNQKGDTIVEVLIAIIVVSVVLVAAYQTTMQSINGVETTQEQSEALQLAQTQLEYLHNAITLPTPGDCYTSTSPNPVSGASCKVDASGAPTLVQPQFDLSFSNVGNTYEITVQWASIESNAPYNYVNLYYQP